MSHIGIIEQRKHWFSRTSHIKEIVHERCNSCQAHSTTTSLQVLGCKSSQAHTRNNFKQNITWSSRDFGDRSDNINIRRRHSVCCHNSTNLRWNYQNIVRPFWWVELWWIDPIVRWMHMVMPKMVIEIVWTKLTMFYSGVGGISSTGWPCME